MIITISRIIKLFEKTGIIKRINFSIGIRIKSKNFRIPFTGSKMGLENINMVESWFLVVFSKLQKLKSDGAFFDIGMNVGQTLLKVKSINNELNYLGVEPNVFCVNYLYKLVKLNRFDNVKIYPVGLGQSSNILTLYADNEFASGASVISGFRKNQQIKHEYLIPVISGDDVVNHSRLKVSIIKIDVEGFELDVIKGLENTMKDMRPFIICEVLPNYGNIESARYKRQVELELCLKESNYSILRINESNASLVAISNFGIFDTMEQTNYVFVPNEFFNQVLDE